MLCIILCLLSELCAHTKFVRRCCVISAFTLLILLECYQKILVITANVLVFCFCFLFLFLYLAAHCFQQNWYEENIELACAVVLVL